MGIIGIALGIFQGIRLASDFRTSGETVQNIGMVSDSLLFLNVIKGETNTSLSETRLQWNDSQITLNSKQFRASGMEVEYGISPDTNFYVSQTLSARGRSSKAAIRKATNIDFETKIIGNKVQIPAFYQYPISDKYRNQTVSLKILIPYGKVVITENTVIQSKDRLQSGWINEQGVYENN